MNTFKLLLLIVFGLGFLVAFLISPAKLFLAYILIKPVVDRFAEQGAMIGGIAIGFHYLPALILPTMSLLAVINSRERHIKSPYKLFILLFIVLNIFAFILEGNYSINGAGFYIRVIFPMFLYFTIPVLLNRREQILTFIKFAAISGVFPCAMILLQKAGYISQNREAEALGSVIYDRATGGYADSFSVALPIIISIFCLLFLLQYGKLSKRLASIYWILLGVYIFSLIFTFHRMTFIVVSLVLVLWTVINRRASFAMIAIAVAVINLPILVVFVPDFFGDISLVDKAANSGVVAMGNADSGLAHGAWHGRGWLWKRFLEKFMDANFGQQLFGINMPGRAPHNDYLRILITNGLFGLTVYLLMLAVIGKRLLSCLRQARRWNDPFLYQLTLTASFMFIFYILSSMTLAISLLSTMSWFFWIFIGMAFHQNRRAFLDIYSSRQANKSAGRQKISISSGIQENPDILRRKK